MANVTGTYKSYDQVGKKEDIEDIIYDISPTLTPFTSSIGTSTASAVLHQWQEDELAAVGTNAVVEGADAGASSVDTTTLKSAYTQIFSKVVQTSGTADVVEKYGRGSELQYQIAKKGKELRRDIEHAFVGAGQAGAAGDGSTARQLKSAQNQIDASTTSTAGSNRTFTETLLLDTLQDVYEAGGDPNQIQVTPSHSLVVAGFAASSGRTRDIESGTKLVNAVDLYVSPFGECAVVPNRFLDANSCLVLDTEYWSRAVLRPMQTIVLAKTGDSDKRQMLTEQTLVCENSKASGLIEALTA
ncbi:DUF5309 domain-containing protein [Alphaproteobacteria bacterium]|nr:DUF5309 domain-containing protein [Alphaproteobacteria bacterium]